MTYDARDNASVRAVRLEMAGRTRRDAASCDYRAPAPCPARRAFTAAGAGRARRTATTPLASWPRTRPATRPPWQRRIAVDGTPPGAVLERARGRTIVLVADRQRVRRRERHARGAPQLDGAVPDAQRDRRQRAAAGAARPRERVADRHARDGPRRGGQRRPGQPDAPHRHEREGRPPLPPRPLRPREGAVRPPRDPARPAHALRRPVARGPDDRRHRRGPPPRRPRAPRRHAP